MTFEFAIDGMSCGSCVARIEKALKKISGVESVQIELSTGKASIQVGSEGPSGDLLSSAILAAGYDARPLVEKKAP